MERVGDTSPFHDEEAPELEKLINQTGNNSCPCFQPQQNCQEWTGHRLKHLLSPEHGLYRLRFKTVSTSVRIDVELSCCWTKNFTSTCENNESEILDLQQCIAWQGKQNCLQLKPLSTSRSVLCFIIFLVFSSNGIWKVYVLIGKGIIMSDVKTLKKWCGAMFIA